MRRRIVVLVLAVGAVLAVGLGLPFCGTETETAHDKCTLGAPEGTRDTFVDGWSWSPLGTRCVLIEADGTRREMVVPPWRGGGWAESE